MLVLATTWMRGDAAAIVVAALFAAFFSANASARFAPIIEGGSMLQVSSACDGANGRHEAKCCSALAQCALNCCAPLPFAAPLLMQEASAEVARWRSGVSFYLSGADPAPPIGPPRA